MGTRYTKEHEWVRIEGDVAVCGISVYAAEKLGDVVYAELPAVGKVFKQDDPMAVVESAKAASDVYAPVSGEVIAVNSEIESQNWQIINDAPEAAGWFVKVKLSNPFELDGLMDEAAYAAYTKG
jgi:glycine cleavage system H protein